MKKTAKLLFKLLQDIDLWRIELFELFAVIIKFV